MVLPLQIRVSDGPVRLTAAAVPYGVSVRQTLDFAFLVETDEGVVDVMTPHQFQEFHARGKHNQKNHAGGSGGGDAGAVDGGSGSVGTGYAPKGNFAGKGADDERDIALVSGRAEGTTGTGGLLTESWLSEDGTITLTKAQEAAAVKKMDELMTSEAEWTANLVHYAGKSMGADAERALKESKWYSHEHDTWGAPLAKDHGITTEQVMAVAASVSTNKKWDGVKSNNKEVTAKILQMLKDDISITITPEQAQKYGEFTLAKPTTGGKYGPRTIEPGEYKMSEMSSGMLARVMGSGHKIGGQYGTDGLYKAFAVARGEISPNDAIGSLKQRSFTNNLARPDVNYSSTNDFWMARAMLGTGKVNLPTAKGIERKVQTVRAWEQQTDAKGKGNGQPNSIFGASGTGSSSLFAVATRSAQNALKQLQAQDPRFEGMKLHEFQAVVWVQMQREYENI